MADNPVAEIGKYISEEYSKEWQRKGSLETRALALATANVAMATLVTAWIDRLKALPEISTGCARILMVLAVGMGLVSVALSLLAATMYTYKSPSAAALRQVVEASEHQRRGVPEAISRAYLGQLLSARQSNDKKFALIAWALGLLVVGAVISVTTLAIVTWT